MRCFESEDLKSQYGTQHNFIDFRASTKHRRRWREGLYVALYTHGAVVSAVLSQTVDTFHTWCI